MSNQREKPEGFADPQKAYALAEFLCGQFAKTTIVFLRHDFGERYFNIFDSLGSSVTLIGFAVVAGLVFQEKDGGYPLGFFLLCFIVASFVHIQLVKHRNRRGRRWHSRYSGTSYLGFLSRRDPFFVQRWIEPYLCFFLGAIVYMLNRPLGVWLAFSGFCIALT